MAETQLVPQAAVARLRRLMSLAGWEIHYIDLDLTAVQPLAEIRVARTDGRWLWARVDALGRSTLETFHRASSLGMSCDTKGRRPLSPQVKDEFLGRRSFTGPRAMLRSLTAYIADNATEPVALADVRASWAAVMGSPLQLQTPAAGIHNKEIALG